MITKLHQIVEDLSISDNIVFVELAHQLVVLGNLFFRGPTKLSHTIFIALLYTKPSTAIVITEAKFKTEKHRR
jgi:hypothetical protein